MRLLFLDAVMAIVQPLPIVLLITADHYTFTPSSFRSCSFSRATLPLCEVNIPFYIHLSRAHWFILTLCTVERLVRVDNSTFER